MKKYSTLALGLLLCLTAGTNLQAYSYDAWGTMTGARTLAVNPFFWGPLKGGQGLSMDMVLLYGFTARFDVIADVAELNLLPRPGYALSYLMPRFDLGKNNILAIQFTASGIYPVSFSVTPQYHFFTESRGMAFEFNAGLSIPFSSPSSSSLYAVLAPVWKIVDGKVHLYLEIDPSLAFGNPPSFGLNLVPGVWIGLAGGKHQFSLGIPLYGVTSGNFAVGYAAWYWTTFSI